MKKISIDKIKLNPNNPRNISDEALERLVKSIQEFPEMLEKRPLVVNSDMVILGGNMRYQAAKIAGLTELPVIVADWDEDKQREFIIKDNLSLGEWDFDMIEDEWNRDQLIEWGLELPNFETNEDVKEDDFQIPREAKYKVECGDIYKLGEHRLMCGDSTMIDDVEKLMDGNKADMALNDPPYGMKKESEGVKNDNLNYDKLLQFNRDWIDLQFTYLKSNGSWYCWGIDEPLMDIYGNIIKSYVNEKKATFRNLITWDKGNGQGQLNEDFRMYPIADEKCLFIMCGVQGFNNNTDNYFEGWEPIRDYLLRSRQEMGWDIPTMKRIAGHSDLSRDHWTSKSQFNMPTEEVYKKFQSEVERREAEELRKYSAFKKEYSVLKKEYYSTRAYFNNTHDNQNNVWHFERTGQRERQLTGGHATPKPLALCQRCIKTSCPGNGLVIDFFGGSGSTLIACEQIKRKCYMMEIDPYYCSVIIERWEKLTNQKHEKFI